ncbi:hypothetical protein E3P99_01007 [Wallemia hederae]|uniref:Uncharacterized protein n=1 Tax=Wallemia hederae TaxID=1540922 RepID=A0A4T0FSU3_9BASI|nr:hypothetical protein E3P99_01007 [Wallemia hederae]
MNSGVNSNTFSSPAQTPILDDLHNPSRVAIPSPLSQSLSTGIEMDSQPHEDSDDGDGAEMELSLSAAASASNDAMAPPSTGKRGRKAGTKYSMAPDANVDVHLDKRKRQAPQPFNSQVNNAIASSSKAPTRTRAPKADPYKPLIPAPDFAKPDYSVVEELFAPFIQKQKELQEQGQTPPPVRFPVPQRPDYVVSSAPRIPQNYIVPVPLDTYTKSDYKTRRWSEHTKEIRNISGSVVKLRTWLGSQESEYSNRPPPPLRVMHSASNQGSQDTSGAFNPANIMTPSGVPLSKLDKRTKEYKMIMAQHKAQIEHQKLDEERHKLDAAGVKNEEEPVDTTEVTEEAPASRRMSINNIMS